MTEEFTTEFFWQKCQKKYRTGSGTHPTSENGKLAAFASGRPAFQKHAKHAEGSDTIPTAHVQKALSAGCTNRNFGRSEKDHAAQRGRNACGTATRISASLSRRLSAFFGSTLGQDPKAAKYAVLTPGPGIFVNVRNAPRVEIAPPSETPLFRRVSRCVRSFSESRVCTHFCQRKQM